jgi:ferredoxin
MAVLEKSRFVTFLEQHDPASWNRLLDELTPSLHPVDRLATRIWFGFWPLELRQALAERSGPAEMARVMDLEGNWRLEEQIDSSVDLLYGAAYWPEVKRAVVAHAERDPASGAVLGGQIRQVASEIAGQLQVDESLILGITAVAFMIVQQVGLEALAAVVGRPAEGHRYSGPPEKVAARRAQDGGDLFDFLRGAKRFFTVTWDERREGARFPAILGQDLASAAATDPGEYRTLDYRRPEGPIPVECRVGSCGYCWVGVIGGKDKLTELTEYERARLRYFGYDRMSAEGDLHPPIRLACQARCQGNVTLVIPPWNGELNRRHDREW